MEILNFLRTSKSKPLFLKWTLLNALAIAFLGFLGSRYGNRIHGPSLIAIPVILAAYAWAAYLAARVCWFADDAHPHQRRRFLHDLKNVHHWTEQIQYMAMLATVFGIWTLLTDKGGDLHDRLVNNGGVAFSATFTGIFASLILKQVQRVIEDDLEADDFED